MTVTAAPDSTSTPRAAGAHGDLIGVEDLHTPYWAEVDHAVATAGMGRITRAMPRMITEVTRRAWRASPRLTLLAAVLQLATGVSTSLGLLATANVFTQLLEQGPTPRRVLAALPAVGFVVAAYATRALLESAVAATQATLAPQVEHVAQDQLYTAVIGVDLVAFDDPDFVELVNKASGSALSQLRNATSDVGNLLASLVSMVAAIAAAALLHPLLAPVVLLSALPQGWASVRAAKLAYSSYLRMTSRMRRLTVTGSLITSRTDAAEVRAFTAQPVLLAEHRRIATHITAEALRVEHEKTRIRLIGRALAGVGTGVAYLVLGALLYAGGLPLALAGAAALALRTANTSVGSTVFASNRLYESSFYLDLYTTCLADARGRTRRTASPRPSAATAQDRIGADQARPVSGPAADGPHVVELRDVSFTYPDQDRPAIANINLTLTAGETVALVGENGSGKTTLAKLLTGLYLPDTGLITWDDIDITALDPCQLHNRVAVVMQSPTQWPMTAANNIRIGRIKQPDPAGRRLADAAARSGADKVISELRQGWDTMLSRHFHTGRDLSGGQWQRISIARGLYRDAALVIADEPTAALDARAEHAVFETLRQLPTSGSAAGGPSGERRRITVLITHRLANVRHADQIVVLDQGRVTAHGTHQKLVSQPGTYQDLWNLQASAYR